MTTRRPIFYLGEWLDFLGLTLEEAAHRAGLSKTHVAQLKSGKRRWNEGVLMQLAEGLGLASPLLFFQDPTSSDQVALIWEKIPEDMRPAATRVLKSFAADPAVEPPAKAEPKRRRGST